VDATAWPRRHDGVVIMVAYCCSVPRCHAEPTVMVDEDSRHVVALDGKPSLDLPDEAGYG
jgi:hypothetical protein